MQLFGQLSILHPFQQTTFIKKLSKVSKDDRFRRAILHYSCQKASFVTDFGALTVVDGSFGVGGNIVEISRRLDYALRMLSEVARAQDGSVVSVRAVAEQSDIPYSFGRTIQHEMVKCGLLTTTRGPRGGMCLAIDPDKTTLLDVVELLEGPIFSLDGPSEGLPSTAQLNYVWQGFESLAKSYLSSITVRQFAVDGLVPVAPDDIVYKLVDYEAISES